MDRRGRGASDDARSYALDREIEDVEAVCEATGDPPVRPSFGGSARCTPLPATGRFREIRPVRACRPRPRVPRVRRRRVRRTARHAPDRGGHARAHRRAQPGVPPRRRPRDPRSPSERSAGRDREGQSHWRRESGCGDGAGRRVLGGLTRGVSSLPGRSPWAADSHCSTASCAVAQAGLQRRFVAAFASGSALNESLQCLHSKVSNSDMTAGRWSAGDKNVGTRSVVPDGSPRIDRTDPVYALVG